MAHRRDAPAGCDGPGGKIQLFKEAGKYSVGR
jgi:hypothetical protein